MSLDLFYQIRNWLLSDYINGRITLLELDWLIGLAEDRVREGRERCAY